MLRSRILIHIQQPDPISTHSDPHLLHVLPHRRFCVQDQEARRPEIRSISARWTGGGIFCEEELRLESPGGARISIFRSSPSRLEPQGFRFGGPGPVVEYAVKMRQFPQESLFSNMLARNQIGVVEAEAALGIVLAGYHAATATNALHLQFRRSRNALRNPSKATIGKPKDSFRQPCSRASNG